MSVIEAEPHIILESDGSQQERLFSLAGCRPLERLLLAALFCARFGDDTSLPECRRSLPAETGSHPDSRRRLGVRPTA